MGWEVIAGIAGKILVAQLPSVIDLVRRGVAGEDISHDHMLEVLDNESKTAILDEIWTERRKAEGLPV